MQLVHELVQPPELAENLPNEYLLQPNAQQRCRPPGKPHPWERRPAYDLSGRVIEGERSGVTVQDVERLNTNGEDLTEALTRVLIHIDDNTTAGAGTLDALILDKWDAVYYEISGGYRPPMSVLRILLVDALRDVETMR